MCLCILINALKIIILRRDPGAFALCIYVFKASVLRWNHPPPGVLRLRTGSLAQKGVGPGSAGVSGDTDTEMLRLGTQALPLAPSVTCGKTLHPCFDI